MLCGHLQRSMYKGYGLLLTASDSTCEVKQSEGGSWNAVGGFSCWETQAVASATRS